jgi:hypothetical protein
MRALSSSTPKCPATLSHLKQIPVRILKPRVALGKIVQIDCLLDPERRARLDLASVQAC